MLAEKKEEDAGLAFFIAGFTAVVMDAGPSFAPAPKATWTDADIPPGWKTEGFSSADEALRTVCEVNGYGWNKDAWRRVPCGAYECLFAVDADGKETKEKDCWTCRMRVWLGRGSPAREETRP